MAYEIINAYLYGFLENGSVDSKIESFGIHKIEECDFIGIKSQNCKLDDLPKVVSENFEKLKKCFDLQELGEAKLYNIYHKMDMKTLSFTFTTAIGFKNCEAIEIEETMYRGKCPEVDTLKIRHIGEWKLLGNAWKYGMVRCINKKTKLKYNKKVPSFEFFESVETPKITDICIGIK